MTETERAEVAEAEAEFYAIPFSGDYDELERLFHDDPYAGAILLASQSFLGEKESLVLLCRLYRFELP